MSTLSLNKYIPLPVSCILRITNYNRFIICLVNSNLMLDPFSETYDKHNVLSFNSVLKNNSHSLKYAFNICNEMHNLILVYEFKDSPVMHMYMRIYRIFSKT